MRGQHSGQDQAHNRRAKAAILYARRQGLVAMQQVSLMVFAAPPYPDYAAKLARNRRSFEGATKDCVVWYGIPEFAVDFFDFVFARSTIIY